jgi:hypothetical protein
MNPESAEDFFRNVAISEQTWESSYPYLESNIDWATAVGYLFEKGIEFQIDQDIVHSAVYLMERVLSDYAAKNELDASHFLEIQLHSIACLVVSAKYDGGAVPDIPKFIQACERTDVTSQQFLAAEFRVLQICQQLRRYPPIVIVVASLEFRFSKSLSEIGQNVREMAEFLSDIVILSFDLHTVYPPSLLAEAILLTIEMTIEMVLDQTGPRRSNDGPRRPNDGPRRPNDGPATIVASPHPKEIVEYLFRTIVSYVIRCYPNHPCGVSIAAAEKAMLATMSAPISAPISAPMSTLSCDSPTSVCVLSNIIVSTTNSNPAMYRKM